MQILVFSDLDGTLLDHHTYSWQPAADALSTLKERNIPLILVSSKTNAEIDELRHELDLDYPYVCENGAAIFVPDEAHIETRGIDRSTILKVLATLRDDGFRFHMFSDMTTAEIARATGLDETRAALAAQRSASEPITWQEDEERLTLFTAVLQEQGLRITQGGRFLHVMGQTDKAVAVTWLVDRYRLRHDGVVTIALGDGRNDIDMLKTVDHPIIIPSQGVLGISANDVPGAEIASKPGPQGWQQALTMTLEKLDHG